MGLIYSLLHFFQSSLSATVFSCRGESRLHFSGSGWDTRARALMGFCKSILGLQILKIGPLSLSLYTPKSFELVCLSVCLSLSPSLPLFTMWNSLITSVNYDRNHVYITGNTGYNSSLRLYNPLRAITLSTMTPDSESR